MKIEKEKMKIYIIKVEIEESSHGENFDVLLEWRKLWCVELQFYPLVIVMSQHTENLKE